MLALNPAMQYVAVGDDGLTRPLAFGKAYFTETGTTTPVITYQDSGFSVEHESPVVADANGLFPAVYLDPAFGLVRLRIIAEFGDLADPFVEADPVNDLGLLYPVTMEFIGTPIDDQIVGMHTVTQDTVFPAGWDVGGWAVTPADTDNAVITVTNTNGDELGVITFGAAENSPSGLTTDSAPVVVAAKETLIFTIGSAFNIADFSWSFAGAL